MWNQVFLTSAFVAVAAHLATLVNNEVPEPYMDEIFHIPQTQRYCAFDWEYWDPKITTFPGLYLTAFATSRTIGMATRAVGLPRLASASFTCAPIVLRAINIILAAVCIPVIYNLAAALDPRRSTAQLMLLTTACALYPLHFFYTFLYYTDVASTLFTLSTWLAALHRRFLVAGALGAAAVLMRQTNAVWVAFIAAHIALEACLPITKGTRSRKGGAVVPGAALLSTLRVVLRRMWTLKWHLAGQLWPLAAVVVAFGAFVVHNGGIVVGDKANHAPVRHLMQPLYFALYFTGALAPVFWNGEAMKKTVRYVWSEAQRSPALAGAALAAAVAGGVWAVNHGTLVHPFLLADNRHYTFYLWRRVVNVRPWARFALLPLYLYSVGAVDARLAAGGHHALERVLLAATTCIVLIPAHLIEFRYFTVPFYATLLSMEAPPPRQLAAVVTLFAACNAASLYVFLARPFHWADGSIARFLW